MQRPAQTIQRKQGSQSHTDQSTSHPKKAEENMAKEGKHADRSAPIKVPKRVWHPKARMVRKEPGELLDTNCKLDRVFEDHNKAGMECKKELPPRDGSMHCDPKVHIKEIQDKVQWQGCPPEHRTALRAIIKTFFDVFVQEGTCRIMSEHLHSTLMLAKW